MEIIKSNLTMLQKRNNKRSKYADVAERMTSGDCVKFLSLNEAKTFCYCLRYRGKIAVQRKSGGWFLVYCYERL